MAWLRASALAMFFMLPLAAQAERNVALVIGNSAYQNVNRLPNSIKDASTIAELFKKAGFVVVESHRDLGINDFKRALRGFAAAARDADIAVIYYAGHGIELDGSNYLIPVDAQLAQDIDVEDEALSLDRILRVLEPARRLRLVILDACRDNPFSRAMKRTLGTRSIGRGLAKVEPETSDTLIAFAAKAGSIAFDGDGKNSPFTTALVKYLATPGLDVRIAFGQVRDDVIKATGNRQEPFVYGSLGGTTVSLVPAPAIVQTPAPTPDPDTEARQNYELASQIGTKEAWDAFLSRHPSGFYTVLARAARAKIIAAEDATTKAELATKMDAAARAETAMKAAKEAAEKAATAAKSSGGDKQVKTTALEPQAGDTAARPAPITRDSADIVRLVKIHLQEVGCDPGDLVGKWDPLARHALEEFNAHAGTHLDLEAVNIDTLDAVRARSGRVCPLVCARGMHREGDHCIAITCEPGFTLDGGGKCQSVKPSHKTAKTKSDDKASAKSAPSSSTRSASSGSSAGDLLYRCRSKDRGACETLCNAGFNGPCRLMNKFH